MLRARRNRAGRRAHGRLRARRGTRLVEPRRSRSGPSSTGPRRSSSCAARSPKASKLPAPIACACPRRRKARRRSRTRQAPTAALLNLRAREATSGGLRRSSSKRPSASSTSSSTNRSRPPNAARTYTYTWPGDLAVERASVVVQEPATAQGRRHRAAISATCRRARAGSPIAPAISVRCRRGRRCRSRSSTEGRRAAIGRHQGTAHGRPRPRPRLPALAGTCRRGRARSAGLGHSRWWRSRCSRSSAVLALAFLWRRQGFDALGGVLREMRRAAAQRRQVLRQVRREGRSDPHLRAFRAGLASSDTASPPRAAPRGCLRPRVPATPRRRSIAGSR